MKSCLITCVSGEVKTLRRLNSDLPALLDEWATSLFLELDYVREAQNGVRFKKLYGELEVICYSEFQIVRHLADVHLHLNQDQLLIKSGIHCTHPQMWSTVEFHDFAHLTSCLSATLFLGIV